MATAKCAHCEFTIPVARRRNAERLGRTASFCSRACSDASRSAAYYGRERATSQNGDERRDVGSASATASTAPPNTLPFIGSSSRRTEERGRHPRHQNGVTFAEFAADVRDHVHDADPLPEGLVHEAPLGGTAFFPGGEGVIKPRHRDDLPRVVVVGRDFGSVAYLDECRSRDAERLTQATWGPLLRRFEAADLDPYDAYFTNAFVGFRKAGKNDAPCAAHEDPAFVKRCTALLAYQLDALRPRLIIALGPAAARMLADMSGDLAAWKPYETLAQFDAAGAVVAPVRIGPSVCSVCLLVHPSRSWINVKHRRYRHPDTDELLRGLAAEIAMLRTAVRLAPRDGDAFKPERPAPR